MERTALGNILLLKLKRVPNVRRNHHSRYIVSSEKPRSLCLDSSSHLTHYQRLKYSQQLQQDRLTHMSHCLTSLLNCCKSLLLNSLRFVQAGFARSLLVKLTRPWELSRYRNNSMVHMVKQASSHQQWAPMCPLQC